MKKALINTLAAALAITLIFTSCGNGDDTPFTTVPSQSSSSDNSNTEAETEETKSAYSVSDNLIALTFDDGPGTESSEKILRILAENNAHATFFIVGYNLDERPEIVKKAAEQGNEIGNHTKGHKNLSKSTDSEIREQINYVNDKVESLTGKRPVLLRAPGGNFQGVTDKVGMPLIQWDIDTNDWRHKDTSSGRTEEQRNSEINAIVEHVMTNVAPGDIILMHEIYNFSADVCEILIPKLAAAGYKMVTVSELFEAYGTKLEAGKVYRQAVSAETTTYSNTLKIEPGVYAVTTSSSSLNLRESADINSAVLIEVPKGESLTVTESVEGWAKTSYMGYTGWVSTKYLTPAA